MPLFECGSSPNVDACSGSSSCEPVGASEIERIRLTQLTSKGG